MYCLGRRGGMHVTEIISVLGCCCNGVCWSCAGVIWCASRRLDFVVYLSYCIYHRCWIRDGFVPMVRRLVGYSRYYVGVTRCILVCVCTLPATEYS